MLTVPGLWNSGPLHWQTHWEKSHPGWRRVEQENWDRPEPGAWIQNLDAAIRTSSRMPLLAAHSLGCTLVARWAEERGGSGVAGALLVAPSDVEAPGYPEEGRGFAAMPRTKLPFPSVVVVSTDDEYVTVARAEEFATWWGSRVINIGPAGHINGASGHGPWPEGEQLLREFWESLRSR